MAEKQRSARRGVNLVLVVHLQDLDVPVGAERTGRLPDENREKIDAEAHVTRLDDAGMPGGGLDAGIALRGHSGGAEHVDDTGLGGKIGEFERGFGHREIDDTFRVGECRECIVRHEHAGRRQAGQFAGILADGIRPGAFDGRSQMHALDFVDGADQRAAHAAGRSDHYQSHARCRLRHPSLPFF